VLGLCGNQDWGISKQKGRAPCGCPPLLPLGNLSAAAADQQPVIVEALTTAGFAVLVYVNEQVAGAVAAVAEKVTTLAAAEEVNMPASVRSVPRIPVADTSATGYRFAMLI